MVHLQNQLILFALLVTLSHSLNILLVLPCYGGHYGSMVSIIKLLLKKSDHKLTVIETASLCHKKLQPLKEKYSFEVIQEHSFESEFEFTGMLDFFMKLSSMSTEGSKSLINFMTKFLEQNGDKFDLLMVDMTLDGVLIAAEVFNKPG